MMIATFLLTAATVLAPQNVRLYTGWNLVHLSVAPTNGADAVFRDWPADEIGLYDPGSFVQTPKSALADDALPSPAIRLWKRGSVEETGFSTVPANAVLLVNVPEGRIAGGEPWTTRVWGVPAAARGVWHRTDESTVLNYFGPSLDPEAGDVKLSAYFAGGSMGSVKVRRLTGDDPTGPEKEYEWGAVEARDGEAVALTAEKTARWNGPLGVSPETGVDFGTGGTRAAVTVLNDSATEKRVKIALELADAAMNPGLERPTSHLLVRVDAVFGEDADWRVLTPETPLVRTLQPQETLTLCLAFDRSVPLAAGATMGALLTFADVSADVCSHMKTAIPVVGTAAAVGSTWPQGLWVMDATLDAVTFSAPTNMEENVAARGTMRVRLPMVVDATGGMRLVQRVEVYADAEGGQVVALPTAVPPNAVRLVRRISSAQLPVDGEAIRATSSSAFGQEAVFPFVVEEKSRLNPLLHARHPDHDGLDASFTAPAPSGDLPANYLSKTKPELFSVSNEVAVTWDGATWTPGERLGGTVAWRFYGLNRLGRLTASGRFSMTRITGERIAEDTKEVAQ